MNKKIIDAYASLLKSEMREVAGCTEPASIAFACSGAIKVLKRKNKKVNPLNVSVKLKVSRDVYRNTSTVKVPFLKIKGAKAAVSCGLFSEGGMFNPFASLKEKDRKKMLEMLKKKGWCDIKELDCPGIYVEAEVQSGRDVAKVIIEDKHDEIKKIFLNGKNIFRKKEDSQTLLKIESMEQIKNIVDERIPELEKIALDFLKRQSLIIKKGENFDVLSETERLIRSRMEGEDLPVQTFTGSGNQGLFLSVSFYKLYEKYGNAIVPSFLFALLTQIYMTSRKGRISSFCGLSEKCAPSLVAGISHWKGDKLSTIVRKMNFVSEVFAGLLCEGARKSCADKASAILGYVLNKSGSIFSSVK